MKFALSICLALLLSQVAHGAIPKHSSQHGVSATHALQVTSARQTETEASQRIPEICEFPVEFVRCGCVLVFGGFEVQTPAGTQFPGSIIDLLCNDANANPVQQLLICAQFNLPNVMSFQTVADSVSTFFSMCPPYIPAVMVNTIRQGLLARNQ